MFRPFYEKKSQTDMYMDPDLVARTFGAVIPITAPRASKADSSVPTRQEAPSGIVPSAEKRTAMTLLADLIALKPDSPELADQKKYLINALAPLLQEMDQFTIEVTTRRRRYLRESLVNIRAECRQAEKYYNLQVRNLQEGELNLQNAAAQQENANRYVQALAALEKSGQHLPKWASPAETEEWNQRFEGARAALTEANKEAAEAFQQRNRLGFLVEPAQRKLEALADEEIRLKNELAGKDYYDPELGLSTKPAGHVRAEVF
jgi:chromosome segregation ATPase